MEDDLKMLHTGLSIGGEVRDAPDGDTVDVVSAATGEVIAAVASPTLQDGIAALDAADAASAVRPAGA